MSDTVTFSEEIEIGMPEMTMQGLSENWLFKKLGAVHWKLISQAFNTPSSGLVDESGNRLYASFVRITIEGSNSLENIDENDTCTLTATINRYGTNMLFSDIRLDHPRSTYDCKMITMFSSRKQINNNDLQRSTISTKIKGIDTTTEMPDHALEYRQLKKEVIDHITLNRFEFPLSDRIKFSTAYTINPFYDVNGLNLLYFASYPTITDYTECLYFKEIKGLENWHNDFYTQSRDIFYYANCNPTQKIVYQLHYYEFINENLVKIHSSLLRESDNTIMAKVFTIKRRKYNPASEMSLRSNT